MAYFSNGSEGMAYEDAYCDKCIHCPGITGKNCAVWEIHMLRNTEGANDDESILHDLIPRKGTTNGKCRMFMKAGTDVMDSEAIARIGMLENLYMQQERIISNQKKALGSTIIMDVAK